ncbi:hypothetical protein Tco_0466050 [Tanacetum coccineum]
MVENIIEDKDHRLYQWVDNLHKWGPDTIRDPDYVGIISKGDAVDFRRGRVLILTHLQDNIAFLKCLKFNGKLKNVRDTSNNGDEYLGEGEQGQKEEYKNPGIVEDSLLSASGGHQKGMKERGGSTHLLL